MQVIQMQFIYIFIRKIINILLTPFHLFWIITKTGFLHAINFKFQALFVTYR